MKGIQRFAALFFSGAMLAAFCLPLASCAGQEKKEVLRIYNWEDYICNEENEEDGTIDLISAFEEEYDCKIEYSTFGTNENMYNELDINPGSYDLVCPSDYMIMKMIENKMCEPFSDDFLQNSAYAENVSPYIKSIFEENGWDRYAVGYMWGTMGFMYNPELVDKEDVSEWSVLQSEKYRNMSTLKDSVRDTYFYALACLYDEELKSYAEKYENAELSAAEYNAAITEVMNRTDEETVNAAGEYLKATKKNIYGFEVDSGKNDMVTGKIAINFCWSGDAAYSIYEAFDENEFVLQYAVPDSVSNIWFDGWVIPKGGNVALAEKFLDFISRPENAMMNMNYIGYTSVVAGDEIYEEYLLGEDGFAASEEGAELDELIESGDVVEYNLGYFFTDDPAKYADYTFYAYAEDVDGMLMAQYPTEEIVARCAVMQYFEEEANNRINRMWEDVKGAEIPLGAVIFIAAVVVVLVGIFLLVRYGNEWFRSRPKKGYKKVEK